MRIVSGYKKKQSRKWSSTPSSKKSWICISDFKMLTLASETSICARTVEINCHYLMTLFPFCGTQFKRAEVMCVYIYIYIYNGNNVIK